MSLDDMKGITSTPSIFEKVIPESDEYTDALKKCQDSADYDVNDIYEHLAIADIQAALAALHPVFDKTQARDHYISLEAVRKVRSAVGLPKFSTAAI